MENKTAFAILTAGLLISTTIGIAAISSAANAQSFSCANAQVPSEMAICNSENLIVMDEKLAILFADALVRASQVNQMEKVSSEHSTWLKRRNDCRTDFQCLEKSYGERIELLGQGL